MHDSQWSHFDGTGGYTMDWPYVPDVDVVKEQGMGRKWAWVEWTESMEGWGKKDGVVVLKVNLGSWDKMMMERDRKRGSGGEEDKNEVIGSGEELGEEGGRRKRVRKGLGDGVVK